ncbi:TPA: hypothetical protein R4Y92_001402 [Klebsiella aerogenes]|nr:hypothetical protein [Klebsiella aerogenes]
MLSNKSNEELTAIASKLATHDESGPVLKELLVRWQEAQKDAAQWHDHYVTLTAGTDLIQKWCIKQSEAVSDVLQILEVKTNELPPGQQLSIALLAEKIVPPLELRNSVNQIQATALVDMKGEFDSEFCTSPRMKLLSDVDTMAIRYLVDRTFSRAIARLLYLPIGPVTPERDENGYWCHPATALQPDWNESTPAQEYKDWYASHGLESITLDLFDQDPELEERILDGESSLNEWEPEQPEGDGWFLFSVFSSEDGFHADFTRRLTD